ncbi:DUF1707 SHOCT-like domain-containing protein [Saccharopolyspora rectivirgula]|jgi:hypothetical protein|uniref:DUF1707 domain-containing protein n=1 Tax=Saccharopolyspora rectivirgula TaxID=28042 RepID=A0A073B2W8_9PSEU|nr:DUF1707 domain-containing protein [Saccharopolyspora rectivirgula]KEI45960.1 hypothetical protein GU90_00820 [Saccharopolyspora rectivirgula]
MQPDHDSFRAGDADREAVAGRLRMAFDEGRLTLTEYDERLQAAYSAMTLGELAKLTADLPESSKAVVDESASRSAPVKKEEGKALPAWAGKEWRDWAGATVVMVAIWVVTSVVSGSLLPFWPLIPSGIWAAVLVAEMVFGKKDDGKTGKEGKED